MSTVADPPHVPVLLDAVVETLAPAHGRWIVDGTFGAGGHAKALLAAGSYVVGIDQDPRAEATARSLNDDRLVFVPGNFRDLEHLLASVDCPPPHGVLLDLGVSSMQLDEGERGFAFRHDGPLDMRMSGTGRSAADLVRDASEAELAALLHRYGDERRSRRVARAIVNARAVEPILTTRRLAQVVEAAMPGSPSRRDHPARRTFQALRIVVNDELAALEEALEAASRVLAPGGTLVVIAYHSLEDRIVKQFFKSSLRLAAVTKRPLVASDDEIARNPRARAAKMRVARRHEGGRHEGVSDRSAGEAEGRGGAR